MCACPPPGEATAWNRKRFISNHHPELIVLLLNICRRSNWLIKFKTLTNSEQLETWLRKLKQHLSHPFCGITMWLWDKMAAVSLVRHLQHQHILPMTASPSSRGTFSPGGRMAEVCCWLKLYLDSNEIQMKININREPVNASFCRLWSVVFGWKHCE